MGTTASSDPAHSSPPKRDAWLCGAADARKPPYYHLEHPAAVVVIVRPCFLPEAREVLSCFENEVYPPQSSGPAKFFMQLSEWGPEDGSSVDDDLGPDLDPDLKLNPSAGPDVKAEGGGDDEDCGGPIRVMTVVFPREGIPRLAELCFERGLILMRCELTMVNPDTGDRMTFDLPTAVANMIDMAPGVSDRYSIQRRTEREGAEAYIACGLHEDELQAFLEQKKTPDG